MWKYHLKFFLQITVVIPLYQYVLTPIRFSNVPVIWFSGLSNMNKFKNIRNILTLNSKQRFSLHSLNQMGSWRWRSERHSPLGSVDGKLFGDAALLSTKSAGRFFVGSCSITTCREQTVFARSTRRGFNCPGRCCYIHIPTNSLLFDKGEQLKLN